MLILERKPSLSSLLVLFAFTASAVMLFLLQINDIKGTIRNFDDDKCILSTYDFWENDLKWYINPNYNPFKNCNRKFKPLTELKNGNWRKVGNDTNIECKARCRFTDMTNKIGKWIYEPGPVDCEVLETICYDHEKEIYGHLHTQIVKKASNPKIPSSSEKPNVIVLVLDSLAYGQAKRFLKKTTNYLVDEFQAVEFPFLSKVRTNDIPLWLGKSMIDINNPGPGNKYVKADWTESYFCDYFKDNEKNIFEDFKGAGYTTMLAEDWARGLLNYPNCTEFEKPPVDHYMRPFQVAYEFEAENITKNHLEGQNCREIHHPAMEYLQKFIDAYPDKPQFSFTWSIGMGYSYMNYFFKADDYLEKFLIRNKDSINSSFFILMGGHGNQFPSETWEVNESKTFQYEMKNPYLAISIPEKYRKSDIMERLVENSKSLQTHYDTRATILDILKYQPSTNFISTNLLDIPDEKGHSYLRFQPDFTRNCQNLPIPSEFCLCKIETVKVEDETLSQSFGEKVNHHINTLLLHTPESSTKCLMMQLKKTSSLEKYVNKFSSNVEIYRIDVEMNFASYQALIEYEVLTGEYDFKSVIRTDRYGHTADCINDEIVRPFCYCKSNELKKNNTKLGGSLASVP